MRNSAMSWWEEAEAKAHRAKSPHDLALLLWQRMRAAGVEGDLAFVPAYDLAHLSILCSDLIKLVDGMLSVGDGDGPALRRQGLALWRWAGYATQWTHSSMAPFNQMLDGLNLEPEDLARREEVLLSESAMGPEEQAKRQGGDRNFYHLYERLDLKLSSIGLPEQTHRLLARCLARIYEECLTTLQLLGRIEKDPQPRMRHMARALLDINTTWHFDLGPYHLGYGEFRVAGSTPLGLQTLIMLAFSAL